MSEIKPDYSPETLLVLWATLNDLKFEIYSPGDRRKIENEAEIQKPLLDRTIATRNQRIFKKHYKHGYTLTVYTGFLPEEDAFVEKNMYGFWFIVTNGDNKRVYIRQIHRSGDFLKRAILETIFVDHMLKHVPLDKEKKRMVLYRQKNGLPVWRSINKKEKTSILWRLPDDERVRKYALAFWNAKARYENVYSKTNGRTQRISKIRKKAKVKNPDGL